MIGAIVFALIVAAFAQTPVKPNLAEDFVGEAQYHITRRNEHPRNFHGHWYHDNTGQRERFQVEADHVGQIDLWKLWNSTKGGLEYEFIHASKVCHTRGFQQPYHGAFSFVAGSHYAGTCDGGKGARWTATAPGAFELDLCASVDGKTPYWLERVHLVEDHLRIVVRFHEYKPGRPDAANFILPPQCKA